MSQGSALEAQTPLEQELMDSMAPCCARDIQQMRAETELSRRLQGVDVARNAVGQRMLRHTLINEPTQGAHMQTGECGAGGLCEHARELEQDEEDEDDKDEDDAEDDAVDEDEDEEDWDAMLDEEDPITARIRAERMAAIQHDQVALQQQGKGQLHDLPLQQLLAKVDGQNGLAVCHLNVPLNETAEYTRAHLQRLSAKWRGTDFWQVDMRTADIDVCMQKWGVGDFPGLICFRDGEIVASTSSRRFREDVEEDGHALRKWLVDTGVLSLGIGIQTAVEDSDEDIEDDLPMCGKKGCPVDYYHEHVGCGNSTGGVERSSEWIGGIRALPSRSGRERKCFAQTAN